MIDLKIRELKKEDLQNGFLESLDALRMTSDIDQKKAKEIFEKIDSNPYHKIYVAEHNQKIVGTATLLIEQKFIHNCGLIGHVEDVSVVREHQKKGIGKRLLRHVLDYARDIGCYKTVSHVNDDIVKFDENGGFKRFAVGMRYDHQT